MSAAPLSQRPLLATAAGMEALYEQRSAIDDVLLRGLERPRKCLSAGPRGSGSTSLLPAIEFRLRSEGGVVAYVDARAAGDVLELLVAVADAARTHDPDTAWLTDISRDDPTAIPRALRRLAASGARATI